MDEVLATARKTNVMDFDTPVEGLRALDRYTWQVRLPQSTIAQAKVPGHVAEVRSAVVYEKSASLVKCDYVWKRTDRWINFPWSSLPPVVPGVADA